MPAARTIDGEVDTHSAIGCVSYSVADRVVQDHQQALVDLNYDIRMNHIELWVSCLCLCLPGATRPLPDAAILLIRTPDGQQDGSTTRRCAGLDVAAHSGGGPE